VAPVRVRRRYIAQCMKFQAAGSSRRVQPIALGANDARFRGHTPRTDQSVQSGAPAQRAGRCRSFLSRARAAAHSHDTVAGFGRPPFVPQYSTRPCVGLIRSTRTRTNGRSYRISSGALTPSNARPEAKIVTIPSTSASRAAVVCRSF